MLLGGFLTGFFTVSQVGAGGLATMGVGAWGGGRVMVGGDAVAITFFSSGDGCAGRCGRKDTGGLGAVAFAASTRSCSVGSADTDAVLSSFVADAGSPAEIGPAASSLATCEAA